MERFVDRAAWVIAHRVGTAEEWAQRMGRSGSYVRVLLSRARDADALPAPDVLRTLAEAAGVDPEWLASGTGPTPHAAPAHPRATVGRPRAPRPTPPGGTPIDATNPLLRSLLLAWRSSDCEPEDYEALASLIRGGAAQLAASTDDQAAEVLARWLQLARRLRLAGKPVTFESLAYEGMRPVALDTEGRDELAALGATPPAAPVTVKR